MIIRDTDLLTSLTELTALTDTREISLENKDIIKERLEEIRAKYSLTKEGEILNIRERSKLLEGGNYEPLSGLERINMVIFALKYLLEEKLSRDFDSKYESIDTERDISIDLLEDNKIYLRSIAFSKSPNLFKSVEEIRDYRNGYFKIIEELVKDVKVFNDDQESYMELEIDLDSGVKYILNELSNLKTLDYMDIIETTHKYLNLMIMTRLSSEENNKYDLKLLISQYDLVLNILIGEITETSSEYDLITNYMDLLLGVVKSYAQAHLDTGIIRGDIRVFVSMLDDIYGLEYSEILLKLGQAAVLIKCKLNNRALMELKDFESYNFNNYYPFGIVDDGTHQNIVKFFI